MLIAVFARNGRFSYMCQERPAKYMCCLGVDHVYLPQDMSRSRSEQNQKRTHHRRRAGRLPYTRSKGNKTTFKGYISPCISYSPPISADRQSCSMATRISPGVSRGPETATPSTVTSKPPPGMPRE